MISITTAVSAEIESSQTDTFEYIVPIDLRTIFTGYGPLPAVTGTQDQTGDWDAVGQTRTVHLSDGSSAQELLTSYEYPQSFNYKVHGFTGSLRFLTTFAQGVWVFTSKNPDETHISWSYAFNSRSVLTVPAFWVHHQGSLARLYEKGIVVIKDTIESSTRRSVKCIRDSVICLFTFQVCCVIFTLHTA